MPTIKDVAELSGVCVTTVSRVLNKRGYISKETYEKVYDAMDKLDYQPNQLARNMFRQRTNFIGLLVPDISHPFFAEITHHIEILLFNRGYKMILCNTQKNDAREQDYLNMLRQNKVDGAIVGTHMLETSDYKCLLHNRNTESCRPEMEKVASPFWRKLQNPLEGNPRNGRRHIR